MRRTAHEVDDQIVAAMRAQNAPLSAYDLIGILAKNGERVAPQQIYRALSHLQKRQIVRRIEGLKAFCLEDKDCRTVLYCGACGEHKLLALEEQAEQLTKLAEAAGYKVARAVVELSGQCGKCPETAARGTSTT